MRYVYAALLYKLIAGLQSVLRCLACLQLKSLQCPGTEIYKRSDIFHTDKVNKLAQYIIICVIESAQKIVRLWDPLALGFASVSEFNARRVLFQQSRNTEEALYQ